MRDVHMYMPALTGRQGTSGPFSAATVPGVIHIVLLRGINVGGANRVTMSDLREALEAAGLTRVRTHLQSGNVIAIP